MKRVLGLFLIIGLVATTAIPVSANNADGELCSVQNYDGSIRASALTYGTATANHATRTQLADAGGWCTSMIGIDWHGADKSYDYYFGQLEVCLIHNPGSTLDLEVYANDNYATKLDAEAICRDLVRGNTNNMLWYP